LAIEKSADTTLREFRLAAHCEIDVAKAKTQAAIARSVAAVAEEVAPAAALRKQWQWLGVGVAVAAVAFCLVGWFSYEKGVESGFNKGIAEAQDVKAAAQWVNTADGKAAFRLWKAGDLLHLANCDQPGWSRQMATDVCG
jgi:hypothetical protein